MRLSQPKSMNSTPPSMPEIRPGKSVELLKELHILTRDGKMNQDSRRKLKQIYHLAQFIEPLLEEIRREHADIQLVDHGASKSIWASCCTTCFSRPWRMAAIYGIETRDGGRQSQRSGAQVNFSGMSFLHLSVAESIRSDLLPARIDLVTALHACDTATDDAIRFALEKKCDLSCWCLAARRNLPQCSEKQSKMLASSAQASGGTLAPSAAPGNLAATPPMCCAASSSRRMATGQRHRSGGVGAFDEKRPSRPL